MHWLMGLFSSKSGGGASSAGALSSLQQTRDELRSLSAAHVDLPSRERTRNVSAIALIVDRQPELGAEVIGALRGDHAIRAARRASG